MTLELEITRAQGREVHAIAVEEGGATNEIYFMSTCAHRSPTAPAVSNTCATESRGGTKGGKERILTRTSERPHPHVERSPSAPSRRLRVRHRAACNLCGKAQSSRGVYIEHVNQ